MATIQDIFDWLNQGAQGDIPGTGGEQPNAPTASAPAPPTPRQAWPSPQEQPPPGQAQPSPQEAGEKGRQAGQKAGQGLWAMLFGKQPQKTPGDYSGGIPPHLLDHYNALVQSGLPPNVAHSILTQPSVGEGEKASNDPWPYAYAGSGQDFAAWQQGDRSDALWNQMQQKQFYDQLNLPTYEQDTPGDDDSLGFTRLPSGQYVPGWGGQ